jgi:hypothetical protein
MEMVISSKELLFIVKILHYTKTGEYDLPHRKNEISIYADHAPVHFHVRTPDGDSAVDLATMAELAGCANRKLLAKAIVWALANKTLIQAEWDKLNGA